MTEVEYYPDTRRVVISLPMQEAALVSLLLGRTPSIGPGGDLYEALDKLFPSGLGVDSDPRTTAAHAIPFINTLERDVLAYLAHFPGD